MTATAKTLTNVRLAGLFLFAAALPFNLWATQAGLGLAGLTLVLEALVLDRQHGPRLPLVIFPPVALFVVAVVFSLLASGEPLPGWGAAIGFWPIAAPFILVPAIRDRRTLELMVTIVVGMSALMGVYGIVQHFSGIDLFRVGQTIAKAAPGSPGRFLAIGNFEAHTTYAFSMCFGALLSLALAAVPSRRAPLRRLLLVGAAVVMTCGIVFSYVRSIWLGVALGVGIVAWLKRGLALRVAIAVGLASAILIAAVPSLRARALSIVDPRYNAGRAYIWGRSWQMLADHPVVGIGFGGYRRLEAAYFDPRAPLDQVPRTGAHSTYLHIAVETGVLGLLAFLWLWIRFLRAAWRGFSRAPPGDGFGRGFLAGAIAAVAGFLVGSLFQESFFDGEVAFMLWFVVSGALVIARDESAVA